MASSRRLLRLVALGHLYVTLPAVLLLLGLPALAWWATAPLAVWWRAFATGGALLAGYRAAWEYWGRAVTYWRMRSYAAVDGIDWLRLERLATRWLLLWPTGHPAEEVEIREGDEDRRIREVMERNAEYRELERVYLGFGTPRRYDFSLDRRRLWTAAGSRLLVAAVAGACAWYLPRPYLGLLLLVCVAYPGRDVRLYPHLLHRGSALQLSDAGILTRVPELRIHYWHDLSRYRLYDHERLLVLIDADGQERALDLTYYRVPDYRRLAALLDVYIDRYSKKMAVGAFN